LHVAEKIMVIRRLWITIVQSLAPWGLHLSLPDIPTSGWILFDRQAAVQITAVQTS
jgi:hypothetical protein